MSTEVYMEGVRLDLSEDVSAVFTYAAADVQDFGKRDTTFSKTLIFPGSAWNNRQFGEAFEFTAYNDYDPAQPNAGYNFNAAITAKCVVLVNSIQTFKGVIRLMEIRILNGAVEYECSMQGELGGLFSAIGDKLITGNVPATDDLDFAAYNQTWNHANIIASWATHDSTGGGSGVYYPLLDYGLCTLNRVDFSYQAMRPALYVKQYMEKIFEKAGYTYTCAFFSTSFFKRLIIPHNRDKVYTQTNLVLDQHEVGAGDIVYDNTIGTQMSSNMMLTVSTVLINFTAAYGGYPTGSTFTYTGPTGLANFAVRVAGGAEGGEGRVKVVATLYKNGTAIFGRQMTLTGTATGGGYTSPVQYFELPINVGFQIVSGDIFKVDVTASYPGTAPAFDWHVFLDSTSQLTVTMQTAASVPAVYGDPLNMNDMLPVATKQSDLFLSVAKMFNLQVVEDPLREKHVNITTWGESFDNTNPLNWSDKVDRSKGISLKPMAEVTARYFNFLYEKDNDYDNETYFKRYGTGYADRLFDTGLDFVKEKKELKIIFASSPLIGVSGNDKAVTRIMKLNGAVEERTASKIRILQAKRIAVSSWDFLQDDLTTIINNHPYYGYAGHIDDPGTPQGADLNFGAPQEIYWVPANPYLPVNIVNEYYTPYLAEITDKDSKLLTCFVYLTPVDVMNLNFAKAVVIDGQLFRLNKLVEYDMVHDDVTKAELLKVINLSYP